MKMMEEKLRWHRSEIGWWSAEIFHVVSAVYTVALSTLIEHIPSLSSLS
jgi:hypothetical protein